MSISKCLVPVESLGSNHWSGYVDGRVCEKNPQSWRTKTLVAESGDRCGVNPFVNGPIAAPSSGLRLAWSETRMTSEHIAV